MADGKLTDFLLGRVRDADTVVDSEGTVHRLRGVDTPELDTEAGQQTTDLVRHLLSEGESTILPTGEQGAFGREISDIRLPSGKSLAEFLVEEGQGRQTARGDEALSQAESRGVDQRVLGLQPDTVDLSGEIDLGGATATDVQPRGGTFGLAVERGTDTLQMLGFSAGNVAAQFIGDALGTETLDDWGIEGLKRNMIEASLNPAQIEKWDDVESLGTLATYVVEALGEQVPNLASLIGTGGVGAAAARAAVGKKLALNALKHRNNLQAVQLQQAGQRGMTAGVGAGSFTLGAGEIGQELREAGIDSPGTALLGAVPFALLDTIGFQATIGRLFRGVDPDIATQSVKDIGKSIFQAAGVGAGAESSTEMLQEVISLSARAFHDPTFEIFSDENLERIKEAGIKAGFVGGITAGAATGATSTAGKLTSSRDEPLPPPPDGTDASQTGTPVEAEFGLPGFEVEAGPTNFAPLDTDYGYIPDEASVPAGQAFDEVPVGEEQTELSTKSVLEEYDTGIRDFENRIGVHSALLRCLSR